MLVIRVVRFTFGVTRGIEALGVGDADLMMMAGGFVGWQPIVVSCFVAAFPGLLFGIVQLLRPRQSDAAVRPVAGSRRGADTVVVADSGESDELRMVFFDPFFLAASRRRCCIFAAGRPLFRFISVRRSKNRSNWLAATRSGAAW